ncbi:hypothetical protein [Ornithinibacillus scapharcae]|uniref:WYL domain-containing protein n=1 Tax=Ornithinibacillus scapharcae TaxID=1147159 RepID=UPI000225AE6D|nr:hypothetical protein [Ornithinibacillus scapharcae]
MQRIFQDSLEKKEKIIIYYIDQQNNVTQRYIRVLRIDKGSIVAYCFWRKEVRTFRVDNILTAGPLYRRTGA